MTNAHQAQRIKVVGRVQGVGFRPFILRIARDAELTGWVRNTGADVEIHAEGRAENLRNFIDAITRRAPPLARPQTPIATHTSLQGYAGFDILESANGQATKPSVPPDSFVCDDCLAEMRDPKARRYNYPFTNCTQCGPRYTIIDALPYDRVNTAMSGFPMCDDCASEYHDPNDRHYHAQPLACPACGPALEFRASDGAVVLGNDAALNAAVARLRQGEILAVKGIGGYHIFCDARSDAAVTKLRARKQRPSKPLAVMALRQFLAAPPGEIEEQQLAAPARPIVLINKAALPALAKTIAPGLNEVGLMLPYAPLHTLLLERFGWPIVATSGNISGEPILFDAASVEARLAHVVDGFLHHNRPIRRPADDSVLRVISGVARPMRIGRGLSPMELTLTKPVSRPMLAVGADLKNTIALADGDRLILSPHLGDLASPRALTTFETVMADLSRLFMVAPEVVVCDAHPGYHSSRWANTRGLPVIPILHHHAHAAAAYHECGASDDVLAFTWDGIGLGEDGSLWGGEALLGRPGHWRRVGSVVPLRLIGADKASREAWRCALAACLEAGIAWDAAPDEAAFAAEIWRKKINSPETTSIGRLFDAAAALIGVIQSQSYEGEAAMRLEALARPHEGAAPPILDDGEITRIDWRPLLPTLMDATKSSSERASYFHASLANALVAQAMRIRETFPLTKALLCGGVFQNRLLAESALQKLGDAGFEAFLPSRIPVNDAAIAVGQIIEAQARLDPSLRDQPRAQLAKERFST